jgi:hypothetical protein
MAPVTLVVLMLFGSVPLWSKCQLEIASVFQFQGSWVDRKYNRPLNKNEEICGDSLVERVIDAKSSPEDFLTLNTRDDSRPRLTFRCKEHLSCESHLDFGPLIREEQRKLHGSGLLESYDHFGASRSSSIITRGKSKFGKTELLPQTLASSYLLPRPQVLVLKSAVVESDKPISAALVFRAEAPGGRYQIDICRSPTYLVCSEPVAREFIWQPDTPDNLPFNGLPPGLHILFRLNDDDLKVRTRDRVLVIAVDPSHEKLIEEARDKIELAALAISPDDDGQRFYEAYVQSLAAPLTTH